MKSAHFKTVFYTKHISTFWCQGFILSVACMRDLSPLRAVVGNFDSLSLSHTPSLSITQCHSLSSANYLSFSFFSHLVAFSLWSLLTHPVRADKHIVISVSPPRCRKVPLKCKCVFVHVRYFVLSACASVFIAIHLKTSHRGLFLSSGSPRCCCLTTILSFPEGVIQSFLLSLTTVLNCLRQWLYNCHFVVLILIIKQV